MNKKKKNYLPVGVIAFVLLFSGVVIGVVFFMEEPNTLSLQVMSEDDDGRTFETDNEVGYGNEPGAWANLQVNPSYSFGIRFINVSIPQGAKILDAQVKLFSIGIPGHNHVNCIIYGDDVDDAVNLSEKGCLNRSGRTYTDNFVVWYDEAPYQQWVVTPTLQKIIQEIVNRPKWRSGNAIALLFITQHANDSAVFDNYASGHPAQLEIVWEEPSEQ